MTCTNLNIKKTALIDFLALDVQLLYNAFNRCCYAQLDHTALYRLFEGLKKRLNLLIKALLGAPGCLK